MPEELKGQVEGQPGQPGAVDSTSQPKVAPEPEPSQLPDDAKVKLADGRVVTFGEMQKGVMFEADYRKKTAALADEKRRLDEERARSIQQPTHSSQRASGPGAYAEEEEPDPIAILAEQVQKVQAFQAHQVLAAEITKLSKDFPDADQEAVYQKCWANPYTTQIRDEMERSHAKIAAVKTPPKDRYLDLTDPVAKAKYEEEAIARYNAKKVAGGGAGGFAGGGAGVAVTEPGQPPKDLAEAGDRLRNALKNLSPE